MITQDTRPEAESNPTYDLMGTVKNEWNDQTLVTLQHTFSVSSIADWNRRIFLMKHCTVNAKRHKVTLQQQSLAVHELKLSEATQTCTFLLSVSLTHQK